MGIRVLLGEIGNTEFVFELTDLVFEPRYEDDDDYMMACCNVEVRIKNRNIDYYRNAEMLAMCDLLYLRDKLYDLLNDKIEKEEMISFMEPDLDFHLYPKFDKRNDPNIIVFNEEYAIRDIYVDFIVNLTDEDGVYTGERIIIWFDRDLIVLIHDYLNKLLSQENAGGKKLT